MGGVLPAGESAEAIEPDAVDRRALLWGWGAMVVGMFMAILDIMIVASSLNDIQANLAIEPADIGWIQVSYLIAEVIMIALTAFLVRVISSKWAFFLSVSGFTVMSLACALAANFEQLVLFRILQGFMGGAMIPIVFAVTQVVFPGQKQVRATLILGLVGTTAPAVGPALGGFITELLNWRWLFLINLPAGFLVALIILRMPHIDKPHLKAWARFDFLGLIAMTTFLGALVFVLHEGPKEAWFEDDHLLLWAVIGVLAGLTFFWRVSVYDKPIIHLGVFRNTAFASGTAFAFLQGVGMYGVTYTMTLFLGRVADLNALQIGSALVVTGVAQLFSAPIIEMMVKRMGRWPVLAIGLLMFALALDLNSKHIAQSRFDQFLWPQLIWGPAIMCLFIPINAITFSTLAPSELSNASALHNLVRNLGGAVSFAMINTLLLERTQFHRTWLVSSMTEGNERFARAQQGLEAVFENSHLADPLSASMRGLDHMVSREALVLAFNDVHVVLAGIYMASFLGLMAFGLWQFMVFQKRKENRQLQT